MVDGQMVYKMILFSVVKRTIQHTVLIRLLLLGTLTKANGDDSINQKNFEKVKVSQETLRNGNLGVKSHLR